ncbi:MAG: prepilin peptidase [Marmoricola sp.]
MALLAADHLMAALTTALACAALALAASPLLSRLPEPAPEPEPESESEPKPDPEPAAADRLFSRTMPPPPEKIPYATLAARRSFRTGVVAWSAAAGAAIALALGWTGALLYLVPLVPVCVVLLVVDWRTTFLPTRVIHPTYLGLAVLIPLAALVDRDLDSLYRAGWGWLVVGGWFWVFWFVLRAWGFGDVRLARVLGPALGYLGWSHLVVGLFAMVLLGGLGGAVLTVVHRSLRRRYPYGPFMVVGAGLAVVSGPWLATSLGY